MTRPPQALNDPSVEVGRAVARLAAVAVALLSLAACAPAPTDSAVPSWPFSPEVLTVATPGPTAPLVTCDGRIFPASGLVAATGAERAAGPEFDALRATLAQFRSEFPGSADWTWRLAGRDDAGAIFLARDAADPPGWVSIEVSADASGWRPLRMGQCDLHVVLSPEFGPASWALDPAFESPTPDSIELHILVWERRCSGGSLTTGRMSAAVVEYTSETVTITIGVRPLGGGRTCVGSPGTPALVRLAEPNGERTLLDGGHVPPAPPSPPY